MCFSCDRNWVFIVLYNFDRIWDGVGGIVNSTVCSTIPGFIPGKSKRSPPPLQNVQTRPGTHPGHQVGRLHLKCDGTRAETVFRLLSAKRTSPFKSARASVQSNTGSRGVRISGSNAGYTMFRGSVKGTGYPLHSTVSPSIPLPCVTVWPHSSTGL